MTKSAASGGWGKPFWEKGSPPDPLPKTFIKGKYFISSRYDDVASRRRGSFPRGVQG